MGLPVGAYGLSTDALFVFFTGCLVFSGGGTIAARHFGSGPADEDIDEPRRRFLQKCIAGYCIVLLCIAPFFAYVIYRTGYVMEIEGFAVAARVLLGESDRGGIPRFYQSVTSVGSILAYLAAWLYDGSRRDKGYLLLAALAPLLMSVLTFSRSPVYAIVVGVATITVFRGTVRPPAAAGIVALGIALGVAMGGMLGKGPGFEPGKSSVMAVVENLAVYFVGGPTGFGLVMDDPVSVGEKGLSLRFFTQLASSLGAAVDLPGNVLGYAAPGLGNVYTIYFAYWLDWGWTGVIVMAFLAGYVCTAIYALARRGNLVAGTAVGLVTGSLLNSATGDGIFGSSVPWILILLVVGILRRVPVVALRRSRGPQEVDA